MKWTSRIKAIDCPLLVKLQIGPGDLICLVLTLHL